METEQGKTILIGLRNSRDQLNLTDLDNINKETAFQISDKIKELKSNFKELKSNLNIEPEGEKVDNIDDVKKRFIG